jgi:hypothetical protein
MCHDQQCSRKSIGFEDLTSRLAAEKSSIEDLASTLAAKREKSSINPRGSEDLKGLDLSTGSEDLKGHDLNQPRGSEDLQGLDLPTGSEDLKGHDLNQPRDSEDLKGLDLPTGPEDLKGHDLNQPRASEDLKGLDLPTGPEDLKRLDLTPVRGSEDLKRLDLAARTPNSTKRRKSALCTATRISRARDNDQKTLGTYLPGHHRAFVPAPIQGPDDSFRAPDWFFQEVSRLTSTPVPVPKSPPFLFDMSDASCLHNQNVFESFGYDLKRVIDDNAGSTISFGSEFRSADQLRPLLSRHPLFDAMDKFIYHGMPYIFSRELTAEESLMELTASIARGNHKSATDELEQVKKLISKDFTHGFSVPFPTSTVTLLPSPVVTPLGLAKQWTLDNKGDRVPKFRMKQDLSFSS